MSISWKQAMPVWWSFFRRAVVYGLALGALLGFFIGLYAAFSGVPDRAALYGALAGWIGAVPASMLALKQAISKHLTRLTTSRLESPLNVSI
jgi:hypothetical protein